MIIRQNINSLSKKLLDFYNSKKQFPVKGQLELTYRCNLDCVHCYCRGYHAKERELTTQQWKKIMDEISSEGCMEICFTGGEPLLRKDFLEIYAYAKSKGFLISIFSNGLLFTKEIIKYLQKSPPYSIQITLNGMSKNTYESITRVDKSFRKVMNVIKVLARKNFNIILKTNCLKENKNEITKVKSFAYKLFTDRTKRFAYDPIIFAGLGNDKTPCAHRLSPEELLEVRKSDLQIWKEYDKIMKKGCSELRRKRSYLYHCNSWLKKFFINPYGRLKFCALTEDYSVDLRNTSFKQGFYKTFPLVLKEKFTSASECRNCKLRSICGNCPSLAYLETGNKEAPVEYLCKIAKLREKLFNTK